MRDLTPEQIVRELDRYIVGQPEAKRAVAVALRNRYRRLQLAPEVQAEITPKNILMIGPTGVGKTEIARRLAKLADAPFVKVEATKFTQVGYVGRDVESIIRDLMDTAMNLVHAEKQTQVQAQAETLAQQRILNYLLEPPKAEGAAAEAKAPAGKDAASAGARDLLLAESLSAENSAKTSARAAKPAGRAQPRVTKAKRKRVAEMLANHQLEEQIIEIELEADDGYTSVLEFVAGMASDEGEGEFQELIGAMPGQRKRSRRVSVKEARRILTQEEANKLIDFDQVVEDATKRVEQSGVVFLDELDKVAGAKVEIGPDVSGQGVQRDLLPYRRRLDGDDPLWTGENRSCPLDCRRGLLQREAQRPDSRVAGALSAARGTAKLEPGRFQGDSDPARKRADPPISGAAAH